MLHQAHIGSKGGKCEFAAVANVKGASFGSGPTTGGETAFSFCTAVVRSEPRTKPVWVVASVWKGRNLTLAIVKIPTGWRRKPGVGSVFCSVAEPPRDKLPRKAEINWGVRKNL